MKQSFFVVRFVLCVVFLLLFWPAGRALSRISIRYNKKTASSKPATRKVVTSKPTTRKARSRQVGFNVYAVLIGIKSLKESRIKGLQYPERDARELYRVLTGVGRVPPRNVRLLLNEQATKANIRRHLQKWLPRKLKRSKKKTTVLVYYSGQGWRGGGRSYWAVYDTQMTSPKGLKKSSLSQREVMGWLDRLSAARVALFVDASHSGGSWPRAAVRSGRSRVLLASSRQDQYSVESPQLRHGVFTYALLQALKGAADYNKDGQVTLSEVWGYLNSQVERLALKFKNYRQTPVMSGHIEGVFLLHFLRNRGDIPQVSPKVKSVPSGASVTINGMSRGTTPLKLEKFADLWKVKVWRVEVSKTGYKTWRGEIRTGRWGERELTIRLAPATETAQRPGTVRSVRGMRGMKEVYIPAGTFTMGSPQSYNERQRRVKLSRGFWMLQTEVTQGQFRALQGYNPSRFRSCGDSCPVEKVNWYEALAYANALSKKGGKEECYSCSGSGKGVKCSVRSKYKGKRYYSCPGYRLPTEAEWEYAYRAETTTAFYTGRCISTDEANYNGKFPQPGCPKGKYRKKTVAVKSFGANSWGLYDMAGNVWEWCWDWYGKYRGNSVVDPVGPSTGSYRVIRGGSWYFVARLARAAFRFWIAPAGRYGRRFISLGFRLVRADPR